MENHLNENLKLIEIEVVFWIFEKKKSVIYEASTEYLGSDWLTTMAAHAQTRPERERERERREGGVEKLQEEVKETVH